ncbi:tautomerase family protein [Microbacterium lacticum]
MPKTLVEVRRSYDADSARQILDAVHEALVAAFRMPREDRGVRLIAHAPERFDPPDGLAPPESYTLVTIDCFAGRSLDAKRRLYAEIAVRLAVAGIPRGHVSVLLREIPLENWGTTPGVPAADLDLGFDVEV